MNLYELIKFPGWALSQEFYQIFFILLLSVIAFSYTLKYWYEGEVASSQVILGHNDKKSISKTSYPKIQILFLALFLIFLTGYGYLITYKFDFAWSLDRSLVLSPIFNHSFFNLPIWHNTRFFPLAMQYLNIVGKISQTPVVFAFLNILVVGLSIILLFVLYDKWSVPQRVLFISASLLMPPILLSNFELVYGERDIIFLILIFISCAIRFYANPRKVYFNGAILSALFAMYMKEPIFLIFGGFAGGRLLYFLIKYSDRSISYHLKRYPLEMCLMILSLVYIFALIYFIRLFEGGISDYTATHGATTVWSTLYFYASLDYIFTTFILVLIVRVIYWVKHSSTIEAFWDPLALGAFFYYLAIVSTHMEQIYYTAPADLIAILYLGWLMKNYFIGLLCLFAIASIPSDRNYFQMEALTNNAYRQLIEYLDLHCVTPHKVCTLYTEFNNFPSADWMSSGLDAYLGINFPHTHLLHLKTAAGCWAWVTKIIPCVQSASAKKADIIFLPPKLKNQNAQLVTDYLQDKNKYQLLMKMHQPAWLRNQQYDSYLFTIKSPLSPFEKGG